MKTHVFIFTLQLLRFVRLDETCVPCSDDVPANCFHSCDDTVYVKIQDRLYRDTLTSGGTPFLDLDREHVIQLDEGSVFLSQAVDPVSGTLYLTSEDKIQTLRPPSTVVSTVTERSVHHPTGIEVDVVTGNIYWADYSTATLHLADSTGSHTRTLAVLSAEERPWDLALFQDWVLWSSPGSGLIRAVRKDGGNLVVVARGLHQPSGMSVNINTRTLAVFSADGSIITIYFIDLDCALVTHQPDCPLASVRLETPLNPAHQHGYLAHDGEGSLLVPVVSSDLHNTVYLVKVEQGRERALALIAGVIGTVYPTEIPTIAMSSYKLVNTSQPDLCAAAGCPYLCVISRNDTNSPAPVCLCQDGYYLDEKTCVKEAHTLMYTDQLNIVIVDVESRHESVLYLGEELMQVGVGIDYDPLTKTVYWSDIRFSQIVKVKVGDTPIVLKSNVGHPSGVTIDWITKYIYYVDDSSNTLNVLDNNATMSAVLATFGDSPRSIAVDPINGYLFWSDRGEHPMIIRTKLSGEELTIMTNITLPGSYPNGVALDIPKKMVYWIDAGTDTISGQSYDGSAARAFIYLSASQGFSLSVFDSNFYWSDWQQKRIGRVLMDNSTEPETVVRTFGVIMDIVVFGESFTLATTNPCSDIPPPCSHFCYSTGNVSQPFTCGCPTGISIDPSDPTSCEKSPCEEDNGGCAQNCRLDEDRQVQCVCFDFYELIDGKCEESYLLLATNKQIWKVSALGDSAHAETPVGVSGKVVALDYDSKNNRVFWTDTMVDALFVSDINRNTSKMLVEHGLMTPDGIAYDWVTDTIYWTDMGTKKIGATPASSGAYVRSVVTFRETDKPRAIVVDPKHGKLYFTDWGTESGVYTAWLDGSHLQQILSGNISWPNGLTIDRDNQVLYWVDAREDSLESVNCNGTNRRVIASFPSSSHFFALTLFTDRNGNGNGSMILITDWTERRVIQVKLSDNSNAMYTGAAHGFSQERPFDIHWFSRSVQTDTNACGVDNGGCSHFCFFTEAGAICSCPDRISLRADNKTCVQDPCGVANGGCSQGCRIAESGNVTCTCNEWFKPDPNNRTACIESELSLFVLARSTLYEVSLDTDPIYTKTVPLIPALTSGTSLDIDYRRGRIFWANSHENTLASANLDGSDVKVIVNDVKTPDGIALDWVTGIIYWTDTGTDKIYAANSENGKHKVAFKITGHDRPRAILVAPSDRYMFWTDWGARPLVGRADLDGTSQVSIITRGLGWPNGLAYDAGTKTIYWLDALEDRIESSDVNGGDRRIIVPDGLQHPYGFHLFQNHLYWTDWTFEAIKRSYKDGSNVTIVKDFGSALMDLTFNSIDHQPESPCYGSGQVVSKYDIIHNTFYVGFTGLGATGGPGGVFRINITEGRQSNHTLVLKIYTDRMTLTNGTHVLGTADLPAGPPSQFELFIKTFYITHGVCFSRSTGKFLAGYTSGQRRGYRNLVAAKAACQNYYPDCQGITYERDDKKLFKFTLRRGSKPIPSATNEISWVMSWCSNGRSNEITFGYGSEVTPDSQLFTLKLASSQVIRIRNMVTPSDAAWICPGRTLSPCGIANGGCEGLCLARNPLQGQESRSCACKGDLDPAGIKCAQYQHLLMSVNGNTMMLLPLGGNNSTIKSVTAPRGVISSFDYIFISDGAFNDILTDDKVIVAEPNLNTITVDSLQGTEQQIQYSPGFTLSLRNLDGSGSGSVTVLHGGGLISSVTYDWLNRVIIWLDAKLGIFATSLDGRHRITLYSPAGDDRVLENTETIVVNPYTGELFWTVYDFSSSGDYGGVYSMFMRNDSVPSKLTKQRIASPTGIAVDFRESRIYLSIDNKISVIDISQGESRGTELTSFSFSTQIYVRDSTDKEIVLISEDSIVMVNKYTGQRVKEVQNFGNVQGLKVLHKDQRPKGLYKRVCTSDGSVTLTCPITASIITKIQVVVSANNRDPQLGGSCGTSTVSCRADVTEQVTASCVGAASCELNLATLELGAGCASTSTTTDIEWECNHGNTVCDKTDLCGNGLCIADPASNTPHCYCDEMFYFDPTDNMCYHENFEVLMSFNNQLASFTTVDKISTTIRRLTVLPGEVGEFTFIGSHHQTVYWWNNLTETLYMADRDNVPAIPVIIRDNIRISSLDVDDAGQVWVTTSSSSSSNSTVYDTVQMYLPDVAGPGYHKTFQTDTAGSSLSNIRVFSSKGVAFFVEDNHVIKSIIDQSVTKISEVSSGSITAITIDKKELKLYVAMDYGDILALDMNGNNIHSMKINIKAPFNSLVVPDNFIIVSSPDGIYKLRRTGDLVETVYEYSTSSAGVMRINADLAVTILQPDTITFEGCDSATCDYFCVTASDRLPVCLCPDGYTLNRDTNTCDGMCKVDNGGCDHLCDVVDEGVTCTCHIGYHLADNGKTCLQSTEYILVNVDGDLMKYTNLTSSWRLKTYSSLEGLVSFDVNTKTNEVFWYNSILNSIVKGNISHFDVVHSGSAGFAVSDMAYDWASDNLYFLQYFLPPFIGRGGADTGSRVSELVVTSPARSLTATLVQYDLMEADYLQVHPAEGLLILTVLNSSTTSYQVVKLHLDGTNREVLYTLPGKPLGLALDPLTDKLYWTISSHLTLYRGDLAGSEPVDMMTTVNQPGQIVANNGRVLWLESDGRLWAFKGRFGVRHIGNVKQGNRFVMKLYHADKYRRTNLCEGDNHDCEEFCFGAPSGVPVCGCGQDIPLSSDGQSCGADPLLLVSETNTVLSFNIRTGELTKITGLNQAVIVDYDLKEGKYYWTDIKDNKIYRADVNGDNLEVVIQDGLVTPDGMAVDWVNRNIYWSDSVTSRFEVATLDGRWRRSLHIDKLSKPRGICVDPIRSYVYWADWGTFPFIARMDMDGTNLVILAQQGLGWPNSLSLNLETGKLVWVDARRDVIGMMNVDGTDKTTALASYVEHPFSIDQYLGTFFWSDWYKKSVMSWEYPDGIPESFLATEGELQHGLRIVHQSKQPSGVRTGCTLNNGGCSQLCFAKPDGGRACSCASHFFLDQDQMTCIEPAHRLLVARDQEILHVVLDPTNVTNILSLTVLPIGNITGIVAFDYNVAKKRLIVGDTVSSHIASYNLNGTDKRILADGALEGREGVAVDWVSGNVFWTSAGKIEVVNEAGTARRTIVDNLDKPRAIVIDPIHGQLIWTDWGTNPAIESVDMNGENRAQLITQDIVWPNGLVLDIANSKIYWTEANLDYIGMANSDGTEVVKLVTTEIHQPFSITLGDGNLLWTDWNTKSIESIKLSDPSQRSYVLQNFKKLLTIHYYDNTTQPEAEANDCGVLNNGCSHLCLNTPNGAKCACKDHLQLRDEKNCQPDPCDTDNGGCSHKCSLSPTGVLCLCPELFKLDTDNVTCRASEKSLLISSQDTIYRVTLDTPTRQVSYLNHAIPYPIALAYDAKNERVVCRDANIGLVSVSLDGQSVRQLNDDWKAFSITIDDIAGNMYWVRRNVVKVSRLDGLHIKTLYTGTDDSTVTDIAVYPQKQLLYWTVKQENSGFVYRGGLDARNPMVIDMLPSKPTGIAIDYSDDRVYYVDVMEREHILISMKLDGTDRVKLHQGSQYIFVDLAIDHGTLYWTQSLYNNLNSAKLPDFTEQTVLISYLSKVTGSTYNNVYDLVVVNATTVEGTSGCEDNDCEGLCIGTTPITYSCVCEDGVPVSQTNSSRCGTDPVLLSATRDKILSRDLITGTEATVRDSLTGVTSVAYHSRRNLLFWANSIEEKVMSYSPDSKEVKTVIGYGISALSMIEVDHVTDKIYWLDSGVRSIGAGDIDGKYQVKLPLRNTTEITVFTVYPRIRALYFFDRATRAIYRSGMDGEGETVVVESTTDFVLQRVVSITIDVHTSTLYFGDSDADYIAYLHPNSSLPIKLTSIVTSYPAALVVFQRNLYVAERVQNKVVRVSLGEDGTTQDMLQQGVLDIKINHVTQQPSQTSGCLRNNGGCQHLCLLSFNSDYSCLCANGLVLGPDSKTCVEPEVSLFVAARSNLLRVSLDSTPATYAVLPFSAGTSGAIALTVDILNNVYFWTDVTRDAIVRGWKNDTGFFQEDIVTTDVKTPDGMAYDWVSQILYWSDTGMTHIQVCKPDGSQRKTLLTGLSKPRALAVDYLSGHMYWSEWGTNPRIARADTDGLYMGTVYSGEDVGWPNGLTLHHADRILYWADAKSDNIFSIDLKTGIKTTIISRDMHPFGLTVFEDYLYWTDWQHKAVYQADRHNPSNFKQVVSGWKELMGLAVISKTSQPSLSKTNCSYGNGADYRGVISTTVSGRTCQQWNTQQPHKHSITDEKYPYADIGSHNYCRNPDDEEYPWCYTTDPLVRWEYCSIKRCGNRRYEQVLENRTFWEAQEKCRVLGGGLVTIRDQKENNLIRSKLNVDIRGLVWIGLANITGMSNNGSFWTSGNGAQYRNFHGDSNLYQDYQWGTVLDVRTGMWYKYDTDTTLPASCEIYSQPEGFTTEGNAGGAMCSFPFYLRGRLRYSCQATEGSTGQAATDSKFMCGTVAVRNETERKWGHCHSHVLSADEDNSVQEISAYIDGEVNNDILKSYLSECHPVTNLTVLRNINVQIQQVYLYLNGGGVSSLTISKIPCDELTTIPNTRTTVVTCDSHVTGGVVEVLFRKSTMLCGARFLTLENLAVGKDVQMTNPVGPTSPAQAVDGQLSGECAVSLAPDVRRRRSESELPDVGTQFMEGPQFIRVDLGITVAVAQVILYLNTNINPYEVRVGNDSAMVWSANPSCGGWRYKSSTERVKRINCGREGRYVTVVARDYSKPISVCELEVFSEAAPTYGGTAEGAPCQHPFLHNGKVYKDGCVTEDAADSDVTPSDVTPSDVTPWCYTVPYEANARWGYCQHAAEVNGCAFNNGGCTDLCFNTPIGIRCGCEDHINLLDDGKTCHRNPCLVKNGGCQELCSLGPLGRECGCQAWYKLNDDGITCSKSEVFLIGANKTTIFNLSVDSNPGNLRVLVKDLGTSIGVAYSQKRQRIFWTDVKNGSIFSANFDGTDKKAIVTEGIIGPDCIAYDWVSDTIYWSDGKADTIEVARFDGQFRNVVVNTELESPRGVALHPAQGLMFWTDWGKEPVIETASMNGEGRRVIISENIIWPNGITVDYDENKIIWVDAKLDTIESADLTGLNRRVIESVDVVHPFGATLYGDEIFWTDWGRKSVEAIKKTDGTRRTVYHGINHPMNILAMGKQNGTSACSTSPCIEGICVPVSDNKRVCLCDRMVRQDDKGRCSRSPRLLVGLSDKLLSLDVTKSLETPSPILTQGADSVDFDQIEEHIYFSNANTIFRINYDGADIKRIFQTEGGVMDIGVDLIRDVSVDWIGRNIYFAEIYSGNIYVSTMSGKYRTLVATSIPLLFSLTLSLEEKEVIYSRRNSTSYDGGIFKIAMDGTGSPLKIHGSASAGSNPTSLVVDYQHNRLFWLDILPHANNDYILSSNLDGSRLVKHRRGVTNILGFLSVHDNQVFYFDEDSENISSFYQDSGKDTGYQTKVREWASIKSMGMLHPSRQPWVYSKCGHGHSPCSHLCLLSTLGPDHARCVCGIGYTEVPNVGCVEDRKFAVMVTDSGIFEVNTNRDSITRQLPVRITPSVDRVHVNPVSQEIVFLDSALGQILRTTFEGTMTETLVDHFLEGARELQVDFVSGLLFWIKDDTLQVSNMEGASRKVVQYSGMSRAAQLTVDGVNGVVRWAVVDKGGWKREVKSHVIQSTTYAGTKLSDMSIQSESIKSLVSSPNHGILMWANRVTNKVEYIKLNDTIPNIQKVFKIDVPGVGSLQSVSLVDDDIFYVLISPYPVLGKRKGILYKTRLTDTSTHTKITTVPVPKDMVVYDSYQTYWRGEIKEILSQTSPLTHPAALEFCSREFQGTLATIRDEDQNQEVLEQLLGPEMWIGLGRVGSGWLWNGDTELGVYQNWGPEEESEEEVYYGAIRTDGQWVKLGRNETRGFICQRIAHQNPCKYTDHGCSDLCLPVGKVAQCACPEFVKLGGDGKTCGGNPCDDADCPGKCHLTPTSPVCTCEPGMVIREDKNHKKSCSVSPSSLIVATSNSIIYRSLGTDTPFVMTLDQSHIRQISSVTADFLNRRVYFADKLSNEIFAIENVGSRTVSVWLIHREPVAPGGLGGSGGSGGSGILDVVYDWNQDQLFYLYTNSSGSSHIKRLKLKDKTTNTVLSTQQNISSIWLHLPFQLLYYLTDTGELTKCSLTGVDCKGIYSGVTSVTSDPAAKYLYLSINSTIIKTALDGTSPVDHIKLPQDPSQPTTAVLGDTFYMVQSDLHGDIVTRIKVGSKSSSNDLTPEKLYHTHMEYANTGEYEKVIKIAIMDPSIHSAHIVVPPDEGAVSKSSSRSRLIAGFASLGATLLLLLLIIVVIRLKKRGFTFFSYRRLRGNDQALLENMQGDLTFNNLMHEDLVHDEDQITFNIPFLGGGGGHSSRSDNVEDYELEVKGYENDYELSDAEQDAENHYEELTDMNNDLI